MSRQDFFGFIGAQLSMKPSLAREVTLEGDLEKVIVKLHNLMYGHKQPALWNIAVSLFDLKTRWRRACDEGVRYGGAPSVGIYVSDRERSRFGFRETNEISPKHLVFEQLVGLFRRQETMKPTIVVFFSKAII